jgi:hypothetical protein
MRHRVGSAALVGLLAAPWVVAPEASGQAVPFGPQFEVASTAPDTAYSDVSGADDGFVVVWQRDDGSGVFGRRFDADETPLGAAFPVDTDSAAVLVRPGVAGNADGSFAVVWQGFGGDDHEILGRRFDAGGTPGAEFIVNTETGEAQRNPSVAADGSGGFVVVWDSYNQGHNNDDDDIFGQRFDAMGDPVGSEFAVNAHTTEQQDEPVVAARPNGEFVVVWRGEDDYTYHEGAIGQRFAADGSSSGGEFVVDPTGYRATVAAHAGGFVVAFTNAYYGAAARLFDAAGAPLGPTIEAASGSASYLDVAVDTAGRFLVVWQESYGAGDGDSTAVIGRLMASNGTPIGPDFVVNSYTTGFQDLPAVGTTASGDFVVTWSGDGPSGRGVFGRRFAVPANPPLGVTSNKLVVVDKLASSSKAKFAYVSKDQAAGITKGTGTNVGTISATFSFAYDSAGGAFTLPAGESDGTQGWLVNSDTVAKFVNKDAPSGVTGAKVAAIKPGKLLRIVGKSLGDTPVDLFAGPPSGSILTEYAVTNGGDTFRHCSEFVSSDWKEIAGGTGRKLVAKNGTPAACP